MWSRSLDDQIREALSQEIEAARPELERLEERVIGALATRLAKPSL